MISDSTINTSMTLSSGVSLVSNSNLYTPVNQTAYNVNAGATLASFLDAYNTSATVIAGAGTVTLGGVYYANSSAVSSAASIFPQEGANFVRPIRLQRVAGDPGAIITSATGANSTFTFPGNNGSANAMLTVDGVGNIIYNAQMPSVQGPTVLSLFNAIFISPST